MQLFLDVALNQLVQGFSTVPLSSAIVQKAEDSVNLQVYTTQAGQSSDQGNSFALEFGLTAASGTPVILVFQSAFTRQLDGAGNVYYQGKASFNTSQLLTALGTSTFIGCLGEFRYQLPSGEVERCQDIPFTIYRPIIQETQIDSTITYAATVPAVGSQVQLKINSNLWLVVGQYITLGGGIGVYQIFSVNIDGQQFMATNTGQAGNASPGTNIPIGTSVGNLPPSVVSSYPAASNIELISNRDQSPGTVSISAAGKINVPAVIPVDNSTIILSSGQLAANIDNVSIKVISGKLTAVTSGGVSNLTDAETTTGVSLIYNATGILNRLLAGSGASFDTTSTPGAITIKCNLTDAETTSGQTLISAAAGVLLRLVAGTNLSFDTTSVPGAIKINASGITGVPSLTDAETTTGQTLISNSSGVLFRLIAGSNISFDLGTAGAIKINVSGVVTSLTDAVTTSGTSLINASTGVLNRIQASTGVTFDTTSTPGVIKISAPTASGLTSISDAETTSGTSGTIKRLTSANGSIVITDNGTSIDLKDASTGSGSSGSSPSGPFDPRNGFYLYEDFLWYGGGSGNNPPTEWGFLGATGGGVVSTVDTLAWSGNNTQRANGIVSIATGGAITSAFNGGTLFRGGPGASYNGVILGLGPMDMAARIALQNSALPGTGQGFRLTFGLFQQTTAQDFYITTTPVDSLVLDYSPDNNSGNLRVGYNSASGAITYGNTTGAITAATFYWWEMKIDTSGTVTVYVNGSLVGTFTGVAPLGVALTPFFGIQRNTAASTNWYTYIDALYMYMPYTR